MASLNAPNGDHRVLDLLNEVRKRDIEIAELKAQLREQQILATHDPLTGLYNRRFFDEAAQLAVDRSERSGEHAALIMIDLDHFKDVNDTYGHETGDEVLAAVASRILGCVRRSDLLARYGGEEFVVLMPDTDEGEATKLAERIRLALAYAPVVDEITVTASIGVAASSEAELVADADRALYLAKAHGRDRVEITV